MSNNNDGYVKPILRRGYHQLPLAKLARNLQANRNQSNIWYPTCSVDVFNKHPDLVDPYWFKSYYKLLDNIKAANREKYIVAAPIQSSKTTTTLAALIAMCYDNVRFPHPRNHFHYLTHDLDRAAEIQNQFILMLDALGLNYKVKNNTVLLYKYIAKSSQNKNFAPLEDNSQRTNKYKHIDLTDSVEENHILNKSRSNKTTIHNKYEELANIQVNINYNKEQENLQSNIQASTIENNNQGAYIGEMHLNKQKRLGKFSYRAKVTFTSHAKVTGVPLSGLTILDDPVNSKNAFSFRIQHKLWSNLNKDLLPRIHGGMLIVASRWCTYDLSGSILREKCNLCKGEGEVTGSAETKFATVKCDLCLGTGNKKQFKHLRIPALCDEVDPNTDTSIDGTNRKLDEYLEHIGLPTPSFEQIQKEIDERTWYACYQGKPWDEDNALLSNPGLWTSLPKDLNAVVYGMDGAEGGQDYATIYRLEYNKRAEKNKRIYYVTGCIRVTGQGSDIWGPRFGQFISRKPGKCLWLTGGQENAVGRFLRKQFMKTLITKRAKGDKISRSVEYRSAHNNDRIRFPDPNMHGFDWSSDVIESLLMVHHGSHDGTDDLDALNAAYMLANQDQQMFRSATSTNNWTNPTPQPKSYVSSVPDLGWRRKFEA